MNVNKKKHDTVCVLFGYYDEYGNYREVILENVELKALDKSISENVYLGHDITIQIVFHEEIRVFAKTLKDIEVWIAEDTNYIKEIFDAYSKHNGKPMNGEYIYTTIDLEEVGKSKTSANEIF